MKLTIKSILTLATLLCAVTALQAQIGVGTETPQGMLDLSNNNSAGFVFPKVALTADNVTAPVTVLKSRGDCSNKAESCLKYWGFHLEPFQA